MLPPALTEQPVPHSTHGISGILDIYGTHVELVWSSQAPFIIMGTFKDLYKDKRQPALH